MRRIALLLGYIILFCAGCAGAEAPAEGMASAMPTPVQTPAPEETPGLVIEEAFEVLHDAYEYNRDHVRIVQARLSPQMQQAYGITQEKGNLIYINEVLAYVSASGFYRESGYHKRNTLCGKEVIMIVFRLRTDRISSDHLLFFDAETSELIGEINPAADFALIGYDPQTRALDISKLPAGVTLEGQGLSEAARWEPWDDFRVPSCYLREYAKTGHVVMDITAFYPFGNMEMEYAYEDGAFVLRAVRADNDDTPEVYEPMVGKALYPRIREAGDGLSPAVQQSGTEIMLGEDVLEFFPGKYLANDRDDVYVFDNNLGELGLCFPWNWREVHLYDMVTMEKLGIRKRELSD